MTSWTGGGVYSRMGSVNTWNTHQKRKGLPERFRYSYHHRATKLSSSRDFEGRWGDGILWKSRLFQFLYMNKIITIDSSLAGMSLQLLTCHSNMLTCRSEPVISSTENLSWKNLKKTKEGCKLRGSTMSSHWQLKKLFCKGYLKIFSIQLLRWSITRKLQVKLLSWSKKAELV